MQIATWPVGKPIPYARNARKIPASAIDKVAASIKEFGWRQPIVVDVEGVILAGHTRLLAAKKLGLQEVPVHVAENLTAAQAKAFRLMDNRSHQEAQWDLELLAPEMAELQELAVDLSLTGFDATEIGDLLADKTEGLTEGDACPEVQEAVVTTLGDCWRLGAHRLLCGDSTVESDVRRLLGADVPFLMVTDPPYGVDYDPEWRLETGLNKPWQTRAEGLVQNDDNADWSAAWKLFPGDVAYVWHGGAHAAVVAVSLLESNLLIRAQIIWAKPSLVIGRGAYHWQHEPCWYAVRKGKTAHWLGDRKQSTLWQVENMHRTQGNVDDGKTCHSTQKPIELMRRPILNHTKPGEMVYEPFCGSGTTLIACEKEGRICRAMELDPKYCDVIVRRWQDFTGQQATLDGHGSTFQHVAEGRALGREERVA